MDLNDHDINHLLLNPMWRLENLYHIKTKEGRETPFTRNSIQKKIGEEIRKRKMILKARQFGVSTHELLVRLDRTLFSRNWTCCIIAHEQDSIEKLFRIVRFAYETMDEDLRPRLDRGGGSKYNLFFPEINSRIYCDLESRSDTILDLHVSEAAFMKDSSRLKSTLQAVPMGGYITIESTPNGIANYFYDMWIDQDQPYSKLFFPWFMHHEYIMPTSKDFKTTDDEEQFKLKAKKHFKININKEQLSYRRFKKSELKVSQTDKRKITFDQEYPEDEQTCFLSSGETIFDLFEIKAMIENCKTPIKDFEFMKIFELPYKDTQYVIGADTSEGLGGDYSTAVMIDVKKRSIVATLRSNKWRPSTFADKLSELCIIFSSSSKRPLLAVERNNHGHAVLLKLNEYIMYENLYFDKDEKLGWRTDQVSRPIMINAFIDAITYKHIIINDKNILDECMTLIDSGGKIQAADGKNDDLIIATSIALQLLFKSSTIDLYEDIENKIFV